MSGEEIIGEIKMIKIWKPIYGYENLYEVSNYGEIRSCDRYIKGNKNSKYFKKGKLISISYNHKGYARVRTTIDRLTGKETVFMTTKKMLSQGTFKVMEENETIVEDGEMARRIFKKL